MAQYKTERFGILDYDEADVLRFPQGLVGFADMTRYFMHYDERIEPLAWLQSLDDPDLAFLVCDPFLFFSDYEVLLRIPKSLQSQIGDSADLRALCIVTPQADFVLSTVNLLGPLVLNSRTRNGWQLILEDDSLSTRHFLFPEKVEQRQREQTEEAV